VSRGRDETLVAHLFVFETFHAKLFRSENRRKFCVPNKKREQGADGLAQR
jgi:hypothetical protein